MKTCKKKIALGLSLVLVSASIAVPSTESQAAKMKLNRSSAAIKVGKKVTLKVKGTKKKVKWTTSKKAIASVSGKGVVTGKKVGMATITAKVGKKKFRCKVTVKAKKKIVQNTTRNTTQNTTQNTTKTTVPTPAPVINNPVQSNTNKVSTDQLAANCAVQLTKLSDGVLVTVTNNNTQQIDSLTVTCVLKDENNAEVQSNSVDFDCLASGKSYDQYISVPLEYFSVDLTKSTTKVDLVDIYMNYVDKTNAITESIEESTDSIGLDYTVKNTSDKNVSVEGIVYFYDKSGKMISCSNISAEAYANDTTQTWISVPYDDDYEKLYDSFKVVTHAYAQK